MMTRINDNVQMQIFATIGRYLLGIFFLFQSIRYFLEPNTYTYILPTWIPFQYFWVLLFGFIWFLGAISFFINYWTYVTGTIMALFILAIATLDAFIELNNINTVVVLLKIAAFIALGGGSLMVSTFGKTFDYTPNHGLYIWGRILTGVFFITAGIMHLTHISFDATLIPDFPFAKGLVVFTGICWLATALSFWSNIMSRLAAILASVLILIIIFSITLNGFQHMETLSALDTLLQNLALIGCCLLVGAKGTLSPFKRESR